MSLDAYHHVAKRPAAGAPLVFTFHGTGGDEHQFAGLIEQTLPEAGLDSPRGDVSEHGANRFFRRTGEGIYDMDDLADRTAKMARFIRVGVAHSASPPSFHPASRDEFRSGSRFDLPEVMNGAHIRSRRTITS